MFFFSTKHFLLQPKSLVVLLQTLLQKNCSLVKSFLVIAFLTAQKMKFSIKYFFNKCDQIHRKLRIWSNLLKKSLMENFSFCAVSLFTGL